MTTTVPEWDVELPWLRAGTTRRAGGVGRSRGSGDVAPVAAGRDRRRDAGSPSGCDSASLEPPVPATFLTAASPASSWRRVVWSRQIHGAVTHVHADLPCGETVADDGDGHLTRSRGLLMAVTLADCVPVFLADPARRAVGLLHAGWRGTAAGVLEEGVGAMGSAFGSDAGDLFAHLGPAICGRCYEVGPEVFEALGAAPPARPAPLDLRAVLAGRALAAGVRAGRLTASEECTLCGDGRYYSHRRGDDGRHLAYIGIRE